MVNADLTVNYLLREAAKNANLPVVETMLSVGADPKSMNGWRQTPLMLACKSEGSDKMVLKTVNALLSVSEVNARDEDGWSALFFAASCGRERLCDRLLAMGASTSASEVDGVCAQWLALQAGHGDLSIKLCLASTEDLVLMVRELAIAEGEFDWVDRLMSKFEEKQLNKHADRAKKAPGSLRL